jgi:hypothetical protein
MQPIMPPTSKSDPKERPALFSGPMVRAIRECRKTQTRRIIKPQPPSKKFFLSESGQDCGFFNCKPNEWRMSGAVGVARSEMGSAWPKDFTWRCPYGQPGDRLWVRETAKATASEEGLDCIHYAADDFCREITNDEIERWRKMRGYRKGDGSWVTSIHMPRWASRITLEITGVRVERLQDITETDAAAEGLGFDSNLMGPWEGHATARDAFRSLWESINGPESWALNPFVWVLEFKRLEAAQ